MVHLPFSPTKDQPAANPRSTTDDSPNPAPGEASTPAPRGRLGTAHPTNNQVLLMETKILCLIVGGCLAWLVFLYMPAPPDDQNTDYLRGFKDAVETMDE